MIVSDELEKLDPDDLLLEPLLLELLDELLSTDMVGPVPPPSEFEIAGPLLESAETPGPTPDDLRSLSLWVQTPSAR